MADNVKSEQGREALARALNTHMDLAEHFLDKEGDDSIIDDVLGMAGNLFVKK